jgi:hypothetical protein
MERRGTKGGHLRERERETAEIWFHHFYARFDCQGFNPILVLIPSWIG